LRTVREFRSTDFSPFTDGLKSVLLGCGSAALCSLWLCFLSDED
jgi:hypothetical protein